MPSIHAEQLSRLRAIIKAEVEKPGSRGGVVVGTWPSGRPKYLSELKESHQKIFREVLQDPQRILSRMERQAEPERVLPLTDETWESEFGQGPTETPIGPVYMGENQRVKLETRDSGKRARFFGCVRPTLERPDLIIEMPDQGNIDDRPHKLGFVKAFKGKDKTRFFLSVTVDKEGKEVHISFGPRRTTQIEKDLTEGQVVYLKGRKRGATKMLGAPGLGPAEPDDAQSGHNRGSYPHDQNRASDDNSQSEKRKSYIRLPIIGMTVQKAKGLSQRRCPFCQGWKGTVVRVFESYDDFASSPYYGGGDLVINDPHATRAVWPGKDNVGRPADDWWICIPVHPYCGCHWQPWSPPAEEDEDDPFARWAAQERDESFREARREANRRAYEEANPERFKSAAVTHGQQLALLKEAIRGPAFRKSTTDVTGVFHHHTCAHEEETESWTRSYLRSRRTA